MLYRGGAGRGVQDAPMQCPHSLTAWLHGIKITCSGLSTTLWQGARSSGTNNIQSQNLFHTLQHQRSNSAGGTPRWLCVESPGSIALPGLLGRLPPAIALAYGILLPFYRYRCGRNLSKVPPRGVGGTAGIGIHDSQFPAPATLCSLQNKS